MLPLPVRRQLLSQLYREALLRPPLDDTSNMEVDPDDDRTGHDDTPAGTGVSVEESTTSDPSDQLDQPGEGSWTL